MGKVFIVAVLAGFGLASNVAAQATCPVDGIVLYGQPSDRVVVGPDGAETQPLSREEAAGYELIVGCLEGRLVHVSREGRSLNYSPSGCFHILHAPHSQIISVNPACADIWEDEPHHYSETIRNGIYSIIYRGQLTSSILSAQNDLPSGPPGDNSYILLRSSPANPQMRIHVATFDAAEGGDYNARNCAIAVNLFVDQPGVTVDYWCERAP